MPLYAIGLPSVGTILLHHDRVMVMGDLDGILQELRAARPEEFSKHGPSEVRRRRIESFLVLEYGFRAPGPDDAAAAVSVGAFD